MVMSGSCCDPGRTRTFNQLLRILDFKSHSPCWRTWGRAFIFTPLHQCAILFQRGKSVRPAAFPAIQTPLSLPERCRLAVGECRAMAAITEYQRCLTGSSVKAVPPNTDRVLNLCLPITPEIDPHRTAPTGLPGLSVVIASQNHGLSMEKQR